MSVMPTTGEPAFQRQTWTPDELRAALVANEDEPPGRARSVRAEALLAAADKLGDPETQICALHTVIEAYERGGESFRSPVLFSRLLRLWDRHGKTLRDASRLEYETHWVFKWMTADLLSVPEVPLATVHGFVDEMERRYRLAGYGMRAVYAQRFRIAQHLGDVAEADTHFGRWLAAERDQMSDCRACEHLSQGMWRAERGDDLAALRLWRPTIDNETACLDEPSSTLAASLKPLLRLGRYDEARANHLRGYRLLQGHVELRSAFGRHIEFCVLSGNDERALEILTENRRLFDPPYEPSDYLEFLSCAALLLRARTAAGQNAPVAGPEGRDWPIAELLRRVRSEIDDLTRRFDARNGNNAVSSRIAATINQTPLVAELPLVVVPRPAPPPPQPASPIQREPLPELIDPDADIDFDDLLAEARRLFDVAHPAAMKMWERVAIVADRRGIALDLEAQAQLAEERAADALDCEDMERAVRLLGEAVERYEEGGMQGRAVAVRARGLLAEALRERTYESIPDHALVELYATARVLLARGQAAPEDVLTVRRAQAFEARRATEVGSYIDPDTESDADRESAFDAFAESVEALLADAVEFDVPARAAAAHTMRAEIAQRRGRPEESVPELLAAITLYDRAERPWANLHPNMLLAQAYLAADRDADAERAGLAALEIAGRWPEQRFPAGYTRQVLANATGGLGRYDDSAEHALEAVAWADRHGVPDLAASARHSLAFAYEQLGRDADAAAILESALPEIVEHLDDATVVNARWALARCLGRLEDYRGAAEQYLLAAAIAEHFPQQGGHAMLAASAGHALRAAGLADEARRAFDRAVILLRALPDPINLAKTLRALAWVTFGESEETAHDSEREDVLDQVLLLFAEAAQVLEAAERSGSYERDAQVIAYELAETDDQLARLHLNADLTDKAMPYAERAASGFRALLPHSAMDYDFSEQMVAWLLDRYGSRDAAVERLREAIAACTEAGVEAVRCVAFLEQLSD
ncbi:tetratricopeptide repeat protein [Catenulispora rubra]|uniref:tetratricopeptide repeat protein n=1 Tax=Catenulispora rubra TaxID=280293 RepID=UPI001891FF8A|nr:tetratricopeptide repeat protein [Catenulispora rubra]